MGSTISTVSCVRTVRPSGVVCGDGVGEVQYTFRLDGSRLGEVFKGTSPFNDGTTLRTAERPEQSYPVPVAPERPEEFAPGLPPELVELAQAAAKMAAS